MNFRYPIFLDLSGKKCLVAGEGPEIASKVRGLADAGAKVIYINPQADPAIEALFVAGKISWARRNFEEQDLDDCFLVIADTPDNSRIFELAEKRRVLVNSVDDPEHCQFSFGSAHRQGDLTIAISTNGVAPALAVRLREHLQREVGPEYGELLQMLKNVRAEIQERVPDFSARRTLWYRIVDSEILDDLRAGRQAQAHHALRRMIDETI